MNQTQLIFDFPAPQNQTDFQEENFAFAAENKNAVDFLQKFFTQKSFIQNTIPSFILKNHYQFVGGWEVIIKRKAIQNTIASN